MFDLVNLRFSMFSFSSSRKFETSDNKIRDEKFKRDCVVGLSLAHLVDMDVKIAQRIAERRSSDYVGGETNFRHDFKKEPNFEKEFAKV
jgi:hypothetical protein